MNIKKLINLKCPITFLKVNLSDSEICAISSPDNLMSPIERGNKNIVEKNFQMEF